MPSSPKRPCSTGKTTSTLSSARTPLPGSTTSSPFAVGSAGSTTGAPSVTVGTRWSEMRIRVASPSVTTQAPSGVMPTGTTSYRSGSSAAITLPAETTEMPCSLLRPP